MPPNQNPPCVLCSELGHQIQNCPQRPKADQAPPPPAGKSLDRWDRVRAEAEARGGGNMGNLLWVESRCVTSGLHPLDRGWERHFSDFYASGEFEFIGRFGVRAAKSDSICRPITAEVLLMPRHLERTVTGVCPILSSTTAEAGDRFQTIQEILLACGYRDVTGSRAPIESWEYRSSGGGTQARVIELLDASGHPCEFRIYAATENLAGCTAVAGFGDELDLWGKATGANPAAKVLKVFRSRFMTLPQAKLYLVSATYDRDSEHARLIKNGNAPGQFVPRIGKDGAAKDYADRLRLAKLIRSSDPLLIGPPLPPDSPDNPCWVYNPITPIEEAYRKAKGDLREMFALYGGRLSLAGTETPITLEDAQFMAEQNRALQQPWTPPRKTGDDGLFDYGPSGDAGPERYRGL